jgi:hypothetical protein
MRTNRRTVLLAWTACLSIAVASSASAQPRDAERFFTDGLTAMRSGDYGAACPMLAQSYRLDPLPGALFTLAECEASWGKLSAASAHYRTFVDRLTALPPARRDTFEERRRIAVERLVALTAVMPEIIVDVAAPASSGIVVKRNGVAVEASSFGVGQKVDPGEYVVTAQANGTGVWERRLKLSELERARVAVPWPLPRSAAPRGEPPALSPSAFLPSADSARAAASPMRGWVYLAGGVGAAGLATGVVGGLLAMNDKSSIDTNCPNRLCNAMGQQAVNAGRIAGAVSTVGFSVSPGITPSVATTPRGATVLVEGAF